MNRELVVLILNGKVINMPPPQRVFILQSKGQSGYHFKILDSSPSLDITMLVKYIQLIILPDKRQTE